MGRPLALSEDEVLDALDDAPPGRILGETNYSGPAATISWLAGRCDVSATTVRKVVFALLDKGLLCISDTKHPNKGCRQLLVYAAESQN